MPVSARGEVKVDKTYHRQYSEHGKRRTNVEKKPERLIHDIHTYDRTHLLEHEVRYVFK